MGDQYDLQVKLDVPSYSLKGTNIKGVQIGNYLLGEIIFTPFKDIKCRGVHLEIGYWDTGNGTPHENRLFEGMIFEGSLRANQSFNHRINFHVPETSPVTYNGQNVKIEWFVRLRIDIPFWFDKREEFYFTVLPKIVASKEEINMEPFASFVGRPSADKVLNIFFNKQ